MEVLLDTAEEKRRRIYNVLANAALNEVALEASWMRLGAMLATFEHDETWRELGYTSFPTFMDELRVKYNRGRSALWGYMTAAKSLLPYYTPQQLEGLGISKAREIRWAVDKTKAALPQAIMDAAVLPGTTTRELRALIGQTLCLPDDREPGTWFDFGGTYFTPEEKKEFKDAVRVAIAQLKVKPGTPEHIQRKEIFLAWAREYFGTWAHEVDGPGPQEPM